MATLAELLEQERQLKEEISRQRAAERGDALEKAQQLIKDYQLTAVDLFPKAQGRRRAAKSAETADAPAKLPAKYRDPETGKTWSGKGRAPDWLKDKNKEDFLIAS